MSTSSENTQPMRPLNFPEWVEVLNRSALSEELKIGYGMTIRWYLSFCTRARVAVCHESARDFIGFARQEKSPGPALLEQWKEAIRWLFRQGRRNESESRIPG